MDNWILVEISDEVDSSELIKLLGIRIPEHDSFSRRLDIYLESKAGFEGLIAAKKDKPGEKPEDKLYSKLMLRAVNHFGLLVSGEAGLIEGAVLVTNVFIPMNKVASIRRYGILTGAASNQSVENNQVEMASSTT